MQICTSAFFFFHECFILYYINVVAGLCNVHKDISFPISLNTMIINEFYYYYYYYSLAYTLCDMYPRTGSNTFICKHTYTYAYLFLTNINKYTNIHVCVEARTRTTCIYTDIYTQVHTQTQTHTLTQNACKHLLMQSHSTKYMKIYTYTNAYAFAYLLTCKSSYTYTTAQMHV